MTARDLLAFAQYVFDCELDRCAGDPPMDLDYRMQQWKQWQGTLAEPHWGSCVNVPIACTRCIVEDYYKLADAILQHQAKAEPLDTTT